MTQNSEPGTSATQEELAILEFVHLFGPCGAEQIMQNFRKGDKFEVMATLHQLTTRGLLLRPEIDEQVLYDVRSDYDLIRVQILMQWQAHVEA